MAHTSGNATWTGATLIDSTALENLENRIDTNASVLASGFAPSDHGLVAWTFDPILCDPPGAKQTNGQLRWFRIKVPTPQTCTGVALAVQTAGAGMIAGQNFVGLYDSTGAVLRSSTDCSTAWASANSMSCPFTSPVAITAGTYIVAVLSNATTTNPTFAAFDTAGVGPPMSYGVATAMVRALATSGSYTTLPSTIPAATLYVRQTWVALY